MKKGFKIAVVQSKFREQDYVSKQAYANKIKSLFGLVAKGKGAYPSLVVFPELTGWWIPLLQGRSFSSISELGIHFFAKHPFSAIRSILAGRGFTFPFLINWEDNLDTWINPFKEAAVMYKTYVCPGSSLLPLFDYEVAKGRHILNRGIFNTSCLINPKGRILGYTYKLNLTREEMSFSIKKGPGSVVTYDTELGRIGILICYDGFFDSLVASCDSHGCDILIQPSANPLPWLTPPRKGISISSCEEWLGSGIGSLIQDCENIKISLNPMSVSSILGHTDQGASSVFVNVKNCRTDKYRNIHKKLPEEYRKYPGLACKLESYDREEVLFFDVDI